MKFPTLFAAFVFFPLSLAACGEATPAGDAENGKALYDIHCASCHGADGTGAAGNPGIVGEGGSEVTEIVTNGEGAMPSFGGTLTAAEIADVRAYVESL